jgi:hypothetical protein
VIFVDVDAMFLSTIPSTTARLTCTRCPGTPAGREPKARDREIKPFARRAGRKKSQISSRLVPCPSLINAALHQVFLPLPARFLCHFCVYKGFRWSKRNNKVAIVLIALPRSFCCLESWFGIPNGPGGPRPSFSGCGKLQARFFTPIRSPVGWVSKLGTMGGPCC